MTRRMLRPLAGLVILAALVSACAGPAPGPTRTPPTSPPTVSPPPTTPSSSATTPPTITALPSAPSDLVPNFTHVIIIVFENHEFGSVIAHAEMPTFNRLAGEYSLLTQHYAVRHPSLPNYIALISGDTQGIDSNCNDCFIDAPSLPDQLEAAGYSWRTYQEDMPAACFVGSQGDYAQKHNPFIYFDDIRLNPARCQAGVAPLTNLEDDLQAGHLPDFTFITPNMCYSAHDCHLDVTDTWIKQWVPRILDAPDFDERSLLILTWDEGQGSEGCCGLEAEAGGRVATVLISDLIKNGFEDDTPYSHYSILKTIETAWGLDLLGHAADEETPLIVAPWR